MPLATHLVQLVTGLFFPLLAIYLSLVSPVRGFETLTDDDLRNIPSAGDDDFDIHTGRLLAPILIPRVPGTEGSFRAQQHFVDYFQTTLPDWEVLFQNSTSKTPVTGDKDVPFTNLIFRRDPPGAPTGDVGRLTLVAHYDSLYSPAGFIGATDSAAPCAMLMHIAKSIDSALSTKWGAMQDTGDFDSGLDDAEGVQIVFLDGEEAFLHWTDTDSLYGARSLAEEWETTFHPSVSTYKTPLDSISLFVLLDLLGAKDPRVSSFFLPTHWAYKNMATLEKRMRDLGLLEAKPRQPFLIDMDKQPVGFHRSLVSDDHVPFMARGVDILHLIATPFPPVWHTMEDDGDHLDMPTVHDWTKIVTAFVVEWMDLKDTMPKRAVKGREKTQTNDHMSRRTEL